MANPYRELLAVPGSRTFVAAGFVGRMSMSMVGIGIVLLVSAATGSYGIAGAVSAALSLAYAAGAPLSARLADRYGQRRVLIPLACANASSFALLVSFSVLRMPTWTLFPVAVMAGLSQPSLGAWVRARWKHALRENPARMHTAYSFESVVDEMIFVCGPMIVTAVSTGVHPAAGVGVAASFTLAGCLALAAQRGTEPPPSPPPTEGRPGSVLRNPVILIMAPVFLMLGAVFAAIDVNAIAFAEEKGHKAMAGMIIACYALGSGSAALWYGARHWRSPLHRRFRIGLALLAAGLVPPLLVTNLYLMMFVVFYSGLAISPTIIPAYGLVERSVPPHQLTEGLALVSTTVGLGVALGASAAGRLVDAYGARVAFMFPLGAALVAVMIGLAGTRKISKHELSSRPPSG